MRRLLLLPLFAVTAACNAPAETAESPVDEETAAADAVGEDIDESDLIPLEEEEVDVLDEEALNALGDEGNQVRVTAYRNDGYGGFSRTFNVSDGARISLTRCRRLNDAISSLVVYGPRGTSATVYQHLRCHSCKTYSHTIWAKNGEGRADGEVLKDYGVHDNVTRIYLRNNGYLLNDGVQRPTC